MLNVNTAVNVVVRSFNEFNDDLYNLPVSDKASLFTMCLVLCYLVLLFLWCTR